MSQDSEGAAHAGASGGPVAADAPRRERVIRLRATPAQPAGPGGPPTPTARSVHALSLFRAQRRLSGAIAAVVLVMLFGLPALLVVVPGLRDVQIAGVNLMWLGLGVLIYPVLWGVGRFYERHATRLEEEFRQAVEGTDS